MREKLYELLHCNVCEGQGCITCKFCDDEDACISYMEHRMADHLIANGVEIVKHGRWILHDNGSGTCDRCRFTQKNVWDDDNSQNYCGVCGAKMDGGDNDA